MPPAVRRWLRPPAVRGLTVARSGGWCNPHEFFWAGRHTVWRIVLNFSIAYGASFAQLLVKKNGQVRSRSYDVMRGTFDKISAKSWVNATWRGAIDLNGDSWWDWCQYMTGCDPWHCTRWVSRSIKVTWGHWPRLNSQWQKANRHMLSGVSWDAESESVVHGSLKRIHITSSAWYSTSRPRYEKCPDRARVKGRTHNYKMKKLYGGDFAAERRNMRSASR